MKIAFAIGAVAAGALMLTAWALCAIGKEMIEFPLPDGMPEDWEGFDE